MTDARTSADMSPGLLKVVARAKREPGGPFHSLAHLIDVPALERAYHRQRKDAAVGVDGVSKEEYGRDLKSNLEDLHQRLKTKRYRHQPIRSMRLRRRSSSAAFTSCSRVLKGRRLPRCLRQHPGSSMPCVLTATTLFLLESGLRIQAMT